MKNIKGSLILLVGAFIWGTAFVAQKSGADSVSTFAFNALRSFVGAAFLALVILVRKLWRKKTAPEPLPSSVNPRAGQWPLQGGILCGVILFFSMSFQQGGISIYPEGVAASGRAGFLTATYVVMVALVVALKGKKPHPLVLVSVAGTLCGMYLLCVSNGFSGIYTGDILLLLCAVCFTGHILAVDQYSDTDSFKLSCLQFCTTGVLSLAVSLAVETTTPEAVVQAAVPILYAGVMSSGVAYTLQMVGQKYAEPAVASIVMSLESVFAAIAGCVLLREVLSIRELAGCALVFASVILAQFPSFQRTKKVIGWEEET